MRVRFSMFLSTSCMLLSAANCREIAVWWTEICECWSPNGFLDSREMGSCAFQKLPGICGHTSNLQSPQGIVHVDVADCSQRQSCLESFLFVTWGGYPRPPGHLSSGPSPMLWYQHRSILLAPYPLDWGSSRAVGGNEAASQLPPGGSKIGTKAS